MYKRTPVLLMLSAAALFLSYREVWGRGSFHGGVAVGMLLVGLAIEWFEHLRSRES
jgi:uncharacterized transporter YbjL